MPQKLIYTSAPRLLQAGRSGFGTVAMSKGISPQLVKSAERCSQFSRERGLPSDRVIFSYRTEKTGEGSWHVLSCIRDAGADYSGRTNHEAQHLIFSEREASELASGQITPAGLMAGSPWHRHDGFCGYIEGAIEYGKHVADVSSPFWAAYSFSRDPGCRGNLTTAAAMRGAVFVYGNSLEQQNEENAQRVLCLYAEAQSVCPNAGWGVTYTTYFQPGDEISDYRWIGVPENSPMVEKLQSLGGRQWVTLNDPAPAKPVQTAVEAPVGGQSKVSARAGGTGHGDPEGAAPGSGRHIQGPPTGPSRRPDDPKPIPVKRGLFELLKSNAKGLALALGLIAVVAVSWFLLFPTPPEIEFAQTKLPRYEGKAVEVLIKTLPAGREHEVKVKPPFLTNAGETRVTASIPGKMFGAGRTVSELLLVPHAEATITFDTNSLAQSWQEGNGKVAFSVSPSVDPLSKEPLDKFVRLTFKREDESEWKDTYDGTRNATYLVRAKIDDPKCNYTAIAETKIEVSVRGRPDPKSSQATTGSAQGETLPQTQSAQATQTFFVTAGSDVLERAGEAGIWKSSPSRFTVRNWIEGEEAKSVDQEGKVEGQQGALDEPIFVMKEGLPLKRSGRGQAGGDTSVYTAEYGPSGQTIVLIGLGSDDTEQISQNAVGPYVPGGAWLKSQDGGKHISVECGAGFCAAVSLLPNDSQYILTISTPELGREQLPPSKTLRFDASELLVKLEKRRDLLSEEIKTAKDPKNASSPEKVYFESNIPYLVAKLTNAVVQKSAEEILAASLAEEIKKLPTPQGTQTNRPTEFEVASALYIGALNAAYVNPSIGPRLQLNRDNLTTLANERNPSQKTQAGSDDKNVKSFWLLEPNALKQWLQLQKKVTAAEVIKHSYEWLNRRIRLLQPLKEQSPLHDPGEEVLRALRDGLQVCSSSPLAAFKENVPTNDKSNDEKLKNVEAELDSLRSIGGPKASGSAQLTVQFPDGRSFTLLTSIKLAPPMQINR